MKQKIFIGVGILLLIVAIGYMMKDLFFTGPSAKPNPYEYHMDSIRMADSSTLLYKVRSSFQTSLAEIHGIALDNKGRIMVCGKGGVEVFDNSGKRQQLLPLTGTAGCMTMTSNGNLLLGIEDHVEIMNPDGKIISKWKKEGSESVITSIATRDKDVFVADAGLKTVFHYNISGKKIKRIGEEDPARGIKSFVIPSPLFDLGIDREGALWIVNPGRHLLEKFNFDGDLLSSWGYGAMTVDGFCGCCNPSNFAFLPDGSFVTSEKAIERVKIYQKDGTFAGMVAGADQFEAGTKGLDLAADANGLIYLLDPVKKRVVIYEKMIN